MTPDFSGNILAATGLELVVIAVVVLSGTLLIGSFCYIAGTSVGVMLMGLV